MLHVVTNQTPWIEGWNGFSTAPIVSSFFCPFRQFTASMAFQMVLPLLVLAFSGLSMATRVVDLEKTNTTKKAQKLS